MEVKWSIRKACGRWWAVGPWVHVFDTWEEAVDWAARYHGSEPTA